ncbi:MAG: cyclic nucleotide-binding domain-containing protein, partial [Mariprofundus sp.]|nr:cyclic nucleotide-binding domain-containing protein [Mariprofundus sp.]
MNTAEHIFGCLIPNRTKTLRKKEILFHQGDDVEYIYIVNRGKVKLTRCSVDGNPLVLQLAATGEMLAEASLFSDQ